MLCIIGDHPTADESVDVFEMLFVSGVLLTELPMLGSITASRSRELQQLWNGIVLSVTLHQWTEKKSANKL